jgi:calcineurin-like phosphoesterase family protein
MAGETWFIADLHFSHNNVVKFMRSEELGGGKLRPFDTIEEHDEALIKNWNEIVNSNDTVWILGDLVMPDRGLPHLLRLNGTKKVVPGNHDQRSAKKLLEYVDDLRGVMIFEDRNWVCTHIPVHTSQFDRWRINIHGHLHNSIINDPRYLNVSCEQVNFTPIPLHEVVRRIELNHNRFLNTGKVINFSMEEV